MEERFQHACTFVSNNKYFNVTDDEKLMLYALYKLATVGAPPMKEIHSFKIKESLKYDAWKNFAANYKDENHKELYVTLVDKLKLKYNIVDV